MLPKFSSQDLSLGGLVQGIGLLVSDQNKHKRFKQMYSNDRIAFAFDVLPEFKNTIANYQIEVLGYFDEGQSRVAVRSPHGVGKTFMAAVLTHHAVLTAEEDCKVPTTASAWRQLDKYLWPEIRKTCKFLAWSVIGRSPYDARIELLTHSIKLDNGTVEAFALASDDHSLIEGAHAQRLMYVFDEAKSIPVPTWDAAEGAFSNEGLRNSDIRAFAISTPGNPSGRFYDIHMHKPGYEDWKTRHITLDEAIRAGFISAAWAEQRRKQWGEDSAVYQNRILGEFADSSEDGIIPLSHVRLAQERWRRWKEAGSPEQVGRKVLGIDPARLGRDETVLADRCVLVLKDIFPLPKASVTSTAGKIFNYADGHLINIEMEGGFGAAIYDILREKKLSGLKPVQVGGKTSWRGRIGKLKFANVRAAMWWNMRELLDPARGDEIALPPNPYLEQDLIAPSWDTKSDGTIFLESKGSIMQKTGRSPDYGTACCLSFWNPSTGGGVVF